MTLLRDLRYSLRSWARSPLFALIALLSLAVGLGATITVFTFINAFFLRPVPGVLQPDRLVNLHQKAQDETRPRRFSKPTYDHLRSASKSLSDIAAFTDRGFNLNADGRTELVVGQVVSGNYFEVLGVDAAAGRLFDARDDAAGAPATVVLSYRTWSQKFGSDPEIVGSAVRLNGQPHTVIGIAGERFIGTFIGFGSALFVPLGVAEWIVPDLDLSDRDADLVELTGRLADGLRIEQAQADCNVIAQNLGSETFADQPDYGIDLRPMTGFDDSIRTLLATLVAVLLAVALLVLAIACVNVANMLLVRSSARGGEIAMRLALGASRQRLIGQLLTESLVLAIAGGGLGILVAVWAIHALRSFDPTLATAAPLVLDFQLDPRVLGFALLASLMTGLLFGLAPALRASRPDLTPTLRESSTPRIGRARLRSFLVAGQIALTLLLLIAAGLFARVLGRAASADPGFETTGVVTAIVDTSLIDFPEPSESEDFYSRLDSHLQQVPGVEVASLTRSLPLTFGRTRTEITVPGHRPPTGEEEFRIDFTTAGPRYFETLKIPLLRGRGITAEDRSTAPHVAVVNEAFARRFWGGLEAVGQRFQHRDATVTVVGVARDTKVNTLSEEPTPFLYLPFAQSLSHRATLIARTDTQTEAAMVSELRASLRTFDQDLPILSVMPLDQLLGFSLLPQRIAATAASVLGTIALLLAAFGIYGVVAYSISQRRLELGIRVSLGAGQQDIIRLLTRQALRVIGLGVGSGLLASFASTRFLRSLLPGVNPVDPVAFLAIVLLLGVTTLVASYFPARRAARLAPSNALRRD